MRYGGKKAWKIEKGSKCVWKHAYTKGCFVCLPLILLQQFRVHYGNGTDNDDDNVEHRIVHKTISDVHYPLCKLNLFAFSRCRLKLIFSLLFFSVNLHDNENSALCKFIYWGLIVSLSLSFYWQKKSQLSNENLCEKASFTC